MTANPITHDYLFKVVLIGDSAVGKSSLMIRTVTDDFCDSTPSTIGVEFMAKNVATDSKKNVKLQIWDTAGQERFRAIARSIYHGAKGCFFVFDITNRDSFDNIKNNWLPEFRRYCATVPSNCFFLIGNKADLPVETRAVTAAEATLWAHENGFAYAETSAKEKRNVDEIFVTMANTLVSIATGDAAADTRPVPSRVHITQEQPAPANHRGKWRC